MSGPAHLAHIAHVDRTPFMLLASTMSPNIAGRVHVASAAHHVLGAAQFDQPAARSPLPLRTASTTLEIGTL